MVDRNHKIAYALCLAMAVFGIAYSIHIDGEKTQGQQGQAQTQAPAYVAIPVVPMPTPMADELPPVPRVGIAEILEAPIDRDGFRAYYKCGVVFYHIPDNLSHRDPARIDAQGRLIIYKDPGMTEPFNDAFYHALEQGEHRLVTRINYETNTAEIVVISYIGIADEAGNPIYKVHDGYVDFCYFEPCTSRDCGLRGSG